MNTSVMAERQAKAVAAIEAATARLGGKLEMPNVRAPNPAVKQVLVLEAIAAALDGVGQSDAPEGEYVALEGVPADVPMSRVEPVEAVIPVVKEKPAPKARKGKEL